ncbi:MAG: SDR family oxidoreductase [Proteobacteria bacterium]|nr:SDR family oxidoreductase [Pseudomonadota bacterium]MBU1742144.1 SDR family oxidoreductase [Pseudomonadota bacterium]
MARYLVTGGAGFIGSNLVEALLERGGEVRVLDDLSTGSEANLKAVAGSDLEAIEFIHGDIRDLETCRRACRRIEFVLHQAALGSVPRSIDNPVPTHQVNAGGTLNMLVAAREVGVKRFVSASSSSVYGNPADGSAPKVETQAVSPLSPYAVSKVAAENYATVFWGIYGLPTISLRYFNVFGPRQDPHSAYAAVIPKFLYALLEDRRPQVHGDGRQSRDFSYVDNVVQANLAACRTEEGFGEVYNVACGERHTLLDLLRLLGELTGRTPDPEFIDPRPGDVRHSLAEISKAARVLGYRPRVDFPTGLQKVVELARRCGYLTP